jgi:hypothetical protein
MSFISSQIKEAGYIHPLADDAADEIEQLEAEERKLNDRIKELESQLEQAKKDQARYCEIVKLYISGDLPLELDTAESKKEFDVSVDAAIASIQERK